MTEPLVSVGIPTYNNPEGLEKILGSLMSQSYKNLEIIVSVNPSENEEVNEYYHRLSETSKGINWHFQESNIGLHNNFIFVMQQATGNYFMWAQDDDDWSLGFIKGLVWLLENASMVSVAMSRVQRRDDTDKIFDTFDMKNISVLNAMHDEKVAFLFMGLWRLSKLQEYSDRIFSDISICCQAILDGGVLIDSNELYTKGMRHGKAKEQIKNDIFWYFRVYYYLLKGVAGVNKKMILPVAGMNLVWVIRSYAASGVVPVTRRSSYSEEDPETNFPFIEPFL